MHIFRIDFFYWNLKKKEAINAKTNQFWRIKKNQQKQIKNKSKTKCTSISETFLRPRFLLMHFLQNALLKESIIIMQIHNILGNGVGAVYKQKLCFQGGYSASP